MILSHADIQEQKNKAEATSTYITKERKKEKNNK